MCSYVTETSIDGFPLQQVTRNGGVRYTSRKCPKCGEQDYWRVVHTPVFSNNRGRAMWVCTNCQRTDLAAFRSKMQHLPSEEMEGVYSFMTSGCCTECGSTLLVPHYTRSDPPKAVVACPVCNAEYKGATLGKVVSLLSTIVSADIYRQSIVDEHVDFLPRCTHCPPPIGNLETFRHLALLIGSIDTSNKYNEADRKQIRSIVTLQRLFPAASVRDLIAYVQLFDTAIYPSLFKH